MARSPAEALRSGLLCALLACGGAAHGADPPLAPAADAPPAGPARANDACTEPQQPTWYTASSLAAERSHIVLQNLCLEDTTHGDVRIRADRAEASGLDLASSLWVLTGHVQVYMDQGAGQHNE